MLRLHVATPGLRAHDAVAGSLAERGTRSWSSRLPMPLRRMREGARGEHRIGLAVGGAKAAGHHLLTKRWHEAEHLPAIHERHVGKPQLVLPAHKGLELHRLFVVLGQQQVAALSILEIGSQFVGEGGPACNRLAGEGRLRVCLSLAPHATGTGPGGCRLRRDFTALNDKHFAPLPGDVVGDGAANHPATNDQHLHRFRTLRHSFGLSPITLSLSCRDTPHHAGISDTLPWSTTA